MARQPVSQHHPKVPARRRGQAGLQDAIQAEQAGPNCGSAVCLVAGADAPATQRAANRDATSRDIALGNALPVEGCMMIW